MTQVPASYLEQGYKCEFTESSSAFQTECPLCLRILRNPREASCCGKVFCYTCVSQAQDDSSCCPLCKSKEYQLFYRKGLERALKKLHVQCENHRDGCKWTGELGQYDSHLNLNSPLEERMEGCEYAKLQCRNGCEVLTPRCQILLHEMKECSHKQDDYTELVVSLHFYIQKLKHKMSQKDKQISELESDCTSQKNVHPLISNPDESATIIPVQRTVSNFEEMKTLNGEYVSEPFYTHSGGYKLCLWVWPNGFESAENTHVSAFMCFMKGENDEKLEWPFRGTFTIQLVDQVENKDHKEVELHYNDNFPSHGKRLMSGTKSEGLGIKTAISHESLRQTSCPYLKDDCLKFRITKVEFDTPK